MNNTNNRPRLCLCVFACLSISPLLTPPRTPDIVMTHTHSPPHKQANDTHGAQRVFFPLSVSAAPSTSFLLTSFLVSATGPTPTPRPFSTKSTTTRMRTTTLLSLTLFLSLSPCNNKFATDKRSCVVVVPVALVFFLFIETFSADFRCPNSLWGPQRPCLALELRRTTLVGVL